MKEKWIKIDEIEYTHENLSKIYEQLQKKDIDDTGNLEKLVEDNLLIQELKNHAIPYTCRWSERLIEEKSKIPTAKPKRAYHYFVEILILESYEFKFKKILTNIENNKSDEVEELRDIDDDSEYKKFLKIKNAFTIFMKALFIITVCCIIYMIIKSICNN